MFLGRGSAGGDLRALSGRAATASLMIVCSVALLLAGVASARVTARSRLLWGAMIGSQLTGTEPPWDMAAVSDFDEMARKRLSVLHFGSPFDSCTSQQSCTFYPFPTGVMRSIRRSGTIPFLSWSSQALQSPEYDSSFTLKAIISGAYDSYIRSFALGAKRWGHPFFLRFDWEMNGNWFPWSESANGNSPGQYVAAWRHVHDIFTSVGARNATWVWCPNVDPWHGYTSVKELYPGNAYVDWTCLDGYNWGADAAPWKWASFTRLYRSTYDEIVHRIAPSKPMIVGEVASSEQGGSKAAWIRNMLSVLPTRFPRIRGVLWFENPQDGVNWTIESSPSATGAFASGIRSSTYVGNTFAHLAASPIRAPGPVVATASRSRRRSRAHRRHH